MFVFKAAVVGAGTMGGEIAQQIAAAGIPVVLKDIKQEFVDTGLAKAEEVTKGRLDRLVEKEKISREDADAQLAEVMALIEGTTSYDGFGNVDFVIEAAPERMEIKQAVFAELDSVTPGHAILASNTSSLSITEMGEATLRPDRVCGFHFFYPASVMPLVEIVEGTDTSEETAQAAANFAQAIRKQPIRCGEVPGFVVNRILMSSISEIWRAQEEQGLSIKAIDDGVGASNTAPMGPFFLINMLGLDTVIHVAEHLAEQYGESFYVHKGIQQLVADGKLGAKSGGEGTYKDGEPNLPGDGEPDIDALVEQFSLKAFVEACLLLEEGVAGVREIDLGMMAGSGLDPRRGLLPPFMRADSIGLDKVLERLEALEAAHGERFSPPRILRRLVAQGRLGPATGQGFYPYPQAEGDQTETVKLERRDDGVAVAWLQSFPVNSLSPQVLDDLGTVWKQVKDAGDVRALVIASAIPVVFSAGADIKAFTQMDESQGREVSEKGHAMLRELGEGGIVTIAAVNALAFGGGCELAMACDFRLAAGGATFGQPEIKLGIVPGFGGTQRLPRLVGPEKALEMNLIGEAISAGEALDYGLVSRVVEDHELIDTALAWAKRLAEQAPLAVAEIKSVSNKAHLSAGIEAEQAAFERVFRSADGQEGIAAFLGKRKAQWKGE